jgi:hypothetical protein
LRDAYGFHAGKMRRAVFHDNSWLAMSYHRR